jgi:hypothetical protein
MWEARNMQPDQQAIVEQVAATLDESAKKPLNQITLIVEHCGSEFTEVMVQSAKDIHEEEGLKTRDQTRQRTLGGVFFYLVRGALPHDLRSIIFPDRRTRKQMSLDKIIDWEDRIQIFQSIQDKPKGKVDEMNITLDGRPRHIETRQNIVLATLEATIEPYQTFPRGLPDFPAKPTTFFVYVGKDQWDKQVGNKLQKDEDASIVVEGAPTFDAEMGGIAILVRAIKVRPGTSNRKEQQIREERRQSKIEADRAAQQEAQARRAANAIPEPEGVSAEIAKKLRPLYGARQLFQKRLADIEALPPEKQSGLKAAKMALERTEKQIAMLEAEAGIASDS